MKTVYERLSEALKNNQSGVLLTVIEAKGSTPGRLGDKMIVLSDGEQYGTIGGGKLEYEAVGEAKKFMDRRKPWRKSYLLSEDVGMLCGGSMEILFEPFGQRDKLIIFGAGHVGAALAKLGSQANFTTIVVDNRPEYANADLLPEAHQIFACEYEKALAELSFDANTYVVSVTHGHKYDEIVLEYCIKQPLNYLGVIGSRAKTRKILKKLKDSGIPKDQFSKVFMPVGLNIGAQTPFEIAISIMAEIIAVKYRVDVGKLSLKNTVANSDASD
ncbi:MAG: xanthine dehydrogenase [Calditrichaeota bacterium]|nr:xanthine dehydrogenase [Calditrichota bacterium]